MRKSVASDAVCPPVNPPIKRVFITGGTHGNETNGVVLARHLLKSPSVAQRPSFTTTVVHTNTEAIKRNLRYVEEDLNRCFSLTGLCACGPSLEARRAVELDALFGPKGSASPAADFLLDLHNTTSSSGVALLMAPNDALSHAVAAHLQALDPSVRIVEWTRGVADYPMLPSVARSGMTFEVGPVAWGVIDGALYAQSLRLVKAALDYGHAHNLALEAGGPDGWETRAVGVFRNVATVDYPRDGDGDVSAMVHPALQGADFSPLAPGAPAFLSVDGETALPFVAPEKAAKEAAAAGGVLYPFFVNEAAYYEKGCAFMLGVYEEVTVRVAKTG